MTLRCEWASCKGLLFPTKYELNTHHESHVADLVKSAKGEKTSHCGWYGCSSQEPKKYQSLTALKKHLRRHVKHNWCPLANCNLAFAWPSDLERHIRTVHTKDRSWRCPVENCDRSIDGFVRKDKLDDHINKAHENVRCPIDHCGALILATKTDEHLQLLHSGKNTQSRRVGSQLGNGDEIWECGLPGCETTKSYFNYSSAQRHLETDHLVYYDSSGKMISSSRAYRPVSSREGAFIILHDDRYNYIPCKTCSPRNPLTTSSNGTTANTVTST